MKKLVVLAAIAATLFSCSNEKAIVLPNGAIVKALNRTNIDYKSGSKVCIMKISGSNGFVICNDGEMVDTSYLRSYTENGRPRVFSVRHQIGTVTYAY